MIRWIAALLLLPVMAMAGPSDIVTNQRNAADSSSIPRTVPKPPGTQDGIMGYSGATVLPVHWTIGQGLAIQGGALVSTVPAGPQGPVGLQGVQGIKGDTGDLGPVGPVGATGPQGIQGAAGIKGDTGAQGLPGAKGDAGPAGVAGARGPQGLQGVKGDAGAQGIQGLPGVSAPTPSFVGPVTRPLNTSYQVSSTRNANVNYGVDVTVTALLLAGTRGTVTLQYADNAAMTTNVVNLVSGTSSVGGVLNVSAIQTVVISGWIPAGKYVRLVTVNTAGTPTFAYGGGNETLF